MERSRSKATDAPRFDGSSWLVAVVVSLSPPALGGELTTVAVIVVLVGRYLRRRTQAEA